MKIALALIGSTFALALALPAQAEDAGRCINVRSIGNHTTDGNNTMYIGVSGNRSIYRATMHNNCFAGTTSSDTIVLRDRPSTGRICTALDLDVTTMTSRCIVDSLTRLTPEEAAALPRRMRP
jgi:hypothetical protein